MKIQDAKPGDVLRDKDGAVWLRGEAFARAIYDPSSEPASEIDDGEFECSAAWGLFAAEKYGPFTRLVPEQETP